MKKLYIFCFVVLIFVPNLVFAETYTAKTKADVVSNLEDVVVTVSKVFDQDVTVGAIDKQLANLNEAIDSYTSKIEALQQRRTELLILKTNVTEEAQKVPLLSIVAE